MAGLLTRILDNTLSEKLAKEVFVKMWESESDADTVIQKYDLKQITDHAYIENVIGGILASNSAQLRSYHAGNIKLFTFFVGQVMKATHGKANPKKVNELLRCKLAV